VKRAFELFECLARRRARVFLYRRLKSRRILPINPGMTIPARYEARQRFQAALDAASVIANARFGPHNADSLEACLLYNRTFDNLLANDEQFKAWKIPEELANLIRYIYG
jgi:hypothetical protein